MKNRWNEKDLIEWVSRVVARELQPGVSLPDIEADLVKTGLIDSMGWVGILSGLEEATGISNFGSDWPKGKPQSIRSLREAVRGGLAAPRAQAAASAEIPTGTAAPRHVSIEGWGYALGSLRIEAAQIEKECALTAGTISERAGIRSACRAESSENEVALAQRAADLALDAADLEAGALDLLVCASTTFLELPSLAAALHNRLLLGESCAALDVGGACVGLLTALTVARGLMISGSHRATLVVASEVHTRRLISPAVPGEFRGLFGDGACAFVLLPSEQSQKNASTKIGDFVSGCSPALSSSLRVVMRQSGDVRVDFDGEPLASGAVMTLNQVIGKLEVTSGVSRSEVACFAFHEPNPRLTAVLAQRANIPPEKIARTAETSGNLGSVTCGVNLCTALTRLGENRRSSARQVIFVAAVGPGLLWGGTYIISGG